MKNHYYNVAIIGGGISGAALFYELARYTDIDRVAIFEKYSKIAPLNSNARHNSQTLHMGDIETNYTFEKAKKVKETAKMLLNYALNSGFEDRYIFKYPKMVIGVANEVELIEKRYEKFRELYPYLKLFKREELKKIEPSLVEGRKENIVAMGALDQYCAVNFGEIAKSMIDKALTLKKGFSLYLNSEVYSIEQKGNKYMLNTPGGYFFADFVVVNAGAYSLLLAHEMGFAKELSCLPIGGSYYYAPSSLLNSKVYTVQNEKLPFAAIHGDPDISERGKTRFGPTALALPKLERYKESTYIDFLHSFNPDSKVIGVFYDLLKDHDIREYIFKNMMYEVPGIRKSLFLKEVRKIVPKITEEDLEFAKNVGGLRPQIIDKAKKKLLLGEAKIEPMKGLIFNMTPSPGATSCMGNAFKDMVSIADYLSSRIDMGLLEEELLKDPLHTLDLKTV